jgi:hypothetical protein
VRTVIVRLSPPSGDGQLHGRVEIVGGDSAIFTDDEELLAQLHRASHGDATTD